jgi:hypothetical protein
MKTAEEKEENVFVVKTNQDGIIDKMNSFYRENEKKLELNKSYPPNKNEITQWILKMNKIVKKNKGETTLNKVSWATFASQFSAKLDYISFKSFSEQTRRVAAEIVAKINMSPDDNYEVILVIDGVFNKSNTWVSLLMWPTIGPYVKYIVSSAVEALSIHLNLKSKKKTTSLIIHADDCSYSGNQFYAAFVDIPAYCKKYRVKPSEFIYYMAFPYISINAKDLLREELREEGFKFINIPNNSVEIFPFMKLMEEDGVNTTDLFKLLGRDSKKPEAELFQWTKRAHAIYFDHKLADAVSVLNKILAFGPIRDPNTGIVTTRNLIIGCENFEYQPNDPSKAFGDFDKVCPPPFYKSIVYTINGIKIPEKVLEENSFPEYLTSPHLQVSINQKCPIYKTSLSSPSSSSGKCYSCGNFFPQYIEEGTLRLFCNNECRINCH